MEFKTHILKKPLIDFVESIFYFKDFKPDHSIERVVPTGHVFVIFELDDIPRHTFNNRTLKQTATYDKVWVSGMHKNHLTISAHDNSEMLVVQFKTMGAFPFINRSMHQLNDKVISADQLFGEEIFQLRQHILKNNKAIDKFELVENWLIKFMDSTAAPSDELELIVNELKANTLVEHQKIVQNYSKTQKHLISQFKKYVGLTPKVLHRIFRFNDVLKQIHQNEKLDWSQIAYQFEYADQSHFIKEFNEFSGFNPKQFIDSNFHKDEPNFFPIDRKG